ncbi:transposase [Streptomyces sp. RKCA744]|uniref:transposase n=1 Tax=Streptomyces sp. RKCA744 TaxID=2959340 RepID=UPI00209F5126|nr:transposase [Streptomyces sp. RKCA744]MCO8307125.1 transposase [Streptomyces sp. RKCA744]
MLDSDAAPVACASEKEGRLLHVPAVLVRGQRRRRLKIPRTWPWAEQIVEAFRRIRALPAPT